MADISETAATAIATTSVSLFSSTLENSFQFLGRFGILSLQLSTLSSKLAILSSELNILSSYLHILSSDFDILS